MRFAPVAARIAHLARPSDIAVTSNAKLADHVSAPVRR